MNMHIAKIGKNVSNFECIHMRFSHLFGKNSLCSLKINKICMLDEEITSMCPTFASGLLQNTISDEKFHF